MVVHFTILMVLNVVLEINMILVVTFGFMKRRKSNPYRLVGEEDREGKGGRGRRQVCLSNSEILFFGVF